MNSLSCLAYVSRLSTLKNNYKKCKTSRLLFFFERADLDRYRLVVHYCVQGQGEVKSKSLMTLYNEHTVAYTSSSEAAVAARAAYFVSARRFVVSIFLSFPCSFACARGTAHSSRNK